MEPDAQPSYIAIARIVRTRGNRGEVLVEIHTDFPERFDALEEVWLRFSDGRRECQVLEDVWSHKGRKVLKFGGVDTISSAEKLVGCWVEVEASQAVPLRRGTFFDHDLVGCSVRDTRGNELGVVTGILRISGNNQLVIAGPEGEYLVPAAAGICQRISIEDKLILVDPPEGLIDLNK